MCVCGKDFGIHVLFNLENVRMSAEEELPPQEKKVGKIALWQG